MTQAALEETPDDAALKAFLDGAAEQMGRHNSQIARDIRRVLASASSANPTLTRAVTPATDILPALLQDAQDPLLANLRGCADRLHWREAGFGNLPRQAARHLAVTELVGPNGMFPMAEVRVGLLIQHAAFQYPKHSHAAEELYLVLSGTADWALDDAALTPRPPGTFIHHRAFQPHRMTTRREPLLALWGWSGDIAGSSYSL